MAKMVGVVKGSSVEVKDSGKSFRLEVGGKHDYRKMNGQFVEFILLEPEKGGREGQRGGGVSLARVTKVIGSAPGQSARK